MNELSFFKYKHKVFFIVYLFINSLFVLKYSTKYYFMPVALVFILYFGLTFGGFFLIYKKYRFINNLKNYNFLILSFMIFCVFCIINFYIDGTTLNTDRWSAMDVTIESILNGKYPYAELDHLGQTSSNLPGLFFIGLPFYLMGNVGLLQPFIFLILMLFVFYLKIEKSNKIALLFFLVSSPAYLFEIIGKSDLMSNIFLVLLFISLWSSNFKNNIFKKSILLAFFTALFVLTRGIVVIPLTLFLFSKFYILNLKSKTKFIFWLLVFLLLIASIVLIDLPSYDTIKEHNPFNHQTAFAPKPLIIASLLIPFLFSFKVKESIDVFRFSFYIISVLIIVTFILNWMEEGFYNNLHGNLFDITYLGMIIPFIFFYYSEKFKME